MNVSSPFTVNLSTINGSHKEFQKLQSQLSNYGYSKERGFGFRTIYSSDSILEGEIAKTTPVKIKQINEESGEVEEAQIKRTELIPLRIDIENKLLEVFSDREDTTEAISRLGEISEWNIAIDNIGFNLYTLYKTLPKLGYNITFRSIRISDFGLSPQSTGSCRLKIHAEDEADHIISEYKQSISYLGVEMECYDEEATIGFYQSGSIRIYSSLMSDEKLMESLKQYIRENKEVISNA